MLFSHSPFAALQSTTLHWRGDLYKVSALVFRSGALVFAVAFQRMLLDHLALVARRTYKPGLHWAITTGEMVLGSLLPWIDSRLVHIEASFPVTAFTVLC